MSTTTQTNKNGNINILIAEDHKLVRKISMQIVKGICPNATFYETDSVQGLVELYKSIQFDLTILDIYLLDGDTLKALSTVKLLQPSTKVLFFTMCPENIWGKRVFANGADGFLHKKADEKELTDAVTTVLFGKKYMSSDLQKILSSKHISKKGSNPFDKLSSREFEIMTMLLKGKSLKDIGKELSIQMATVSTLKMRLFDKLNIVSLLELSKIAAIYDINVWAF